MKRIVLFSSPVTSKFNEILDLIFPETLKNKVFAYMPSDGANSPQEFTDLWKGYSEKYNAKFVFIDNSSSDSESEVKKLQSANILMITGGNTFLLLNNLKKSGLDKAIVDFSNKDNFVISGFSAGALVLTPNIEICNSRRMDPNDVGLTDFKSLGIVDFEVYPHYKDSYKVEADEYRKTTENEVRTISDDEYSLIDWN